MKRFLRSKIRYLFLLILSLILIGITLFVCLMDEEKKKTSKIILSYQDGFVEISSNYFDDKEYFFVPSFVSEEEAVEIKENYSAEVVFSAGVSTAFINTASESMNEIYKNKNHKEPVSFLLIDQDGVLSVNDADVELKGRGNSTWEKDKKPFHLTFNDEISILGMGKSDDWILLSNSYDESLIRNASILDAANSIGMVNTPEYRFVDVYLNGEYNGLYLLVQAVDSFVNEENRDIILCSVELQSRLKGEENSFLIESGLGIVVKGLLHIDDLSRDDLENVIYVVKNLNEHIVSDGKSLDAIMDIDSWALKYLVDEIFGNFDAGLASSYFYWFKNGSDGQIVYGGPVWDYDISLGQDINGNFTNPQTLMAASFERGKDQRIIWYKALYDNPVFYQRVVDLYKNVVRNEVLYFVNGGLDEKENLISEAKKADRLRWRNRGDAAEEIIRMKEWLSKRIEFLDSIWIDGDTYYGVIFEDEGVCYKRFSIPAGGKILDDEYYPIMIGNSSIEWLNKDTGEMFDLNTPIYNDIHLIKAGMKGDNSKELKDMIKISLFLVLMIAFCVLVVREVRLRKCC